MKPFSRRFALCTILLAANGATGSESPVVVASTAGAYLDSDLRNGGGTDDTPALQRVLDRAKSGRPVHLIIDGSALITGLNIHGGTVIECLPGGGFYLKSHSDRAMIRNVNRSRDQIRDRDIRIEGCFFNGNREGQAKKAGPFTAQSDASARIYSDRQEADGTFKSILQFFGVENVWLERLTLFNGRAFGSWFANARRIAIRDVEVDANFPPLSLHPTVEEVRVFNEKHRSNGDGLHFSGPVQYLTIEGVRLRTDDDGISLTANNMGVDDITVLNEMGPYVGQGPITDVTIRDVTFMDSLVGLRLLSTTQRIDRVSVENVAGKIRGRGVVLSSWTNRLNSAAHGDFGVIAFNNVSLSPAPFFTWRALYPSLYLGDQKRSWDLGEEADIPVFSINAPVENLSLTNVRVRAIDDRPIVRFGREAEVDMAQVALCIDDANGQSIPVRVFQGHVRRLRLDLDWIPSSGASAHSPIQIEEGRVDEVIAAPRPQ
jgi:hypothetical protein